jgi:hypothetical protein
MTGDSLKFKSVGKEGIDEYDSITFGNNKKGKVIGLGKITISNDLSISNVLLVESLDYNLLSVAQLCDHGYKCIFSSKEVEVINASDLSLIFNEFRHGDLYLVDFNAKEAKLTTCLITQSSMDWLWHRRLGHVGMKQLNKLVKHDLVRGLKDVTFVGPEPQRLPQICSKF